VSLAGPERTEKKRAAFERGLLAEAFVARRLEADGWTVLARNVRASGGELDIVAVREGHLRFVEVKARDPDDHTALEAIGRTKQRKLARAAEEWLAAHGPPERDAAFLVAVVTFDPAGWTLELLDNAFDV
jgi:putative endonuclease